VNYVQLASRLRQEVGGSGTGPSSVLNQTGEYKRFVDYIAQAWTEIQNKHSNWRWMRTEFTLPTVASDDDYVYTDATDSIASATISRFARWIEDDNMKIYLASSGIGTQTFLSPCDWDDFRSIYKFGTVQTGYPTDFAVDPRNHLRFGLMPNGIYTVTGDYMKSAQTLAADADIPEMPDRFHMLIVYEAMKKYAAYESAPEVWSGVEDARNVMMRDLEIDQRPARGYGDALA
jgi:hypothetical protein